MADEVQVTIKMERHEWALMKADARDHGMAGTRFPTMVWRCWKLKQWPLSMIPPLPRDPWRPKEKPPEASSL